MAAIGAGSAAATASTWPADHGNGSRLTGFGLLTERTASGFRAISPSSTAGAALREGREKAEDNQAAYIVRSLLSEGQIEYPTVIRDDDGALRTIKLTKPGPTNLVTSTTSISLHPENETRMFSLPSNDSQQQARQVLVTSSDDDEPRPEPDFSEWHAYQRWLATANRRVVIPFARCVAAQIPPVAVRLRRDWNAVRSLIRTHAVMHQATRPTDDQGRIVASLDDYEAARALVGDLVAEGIGATVPETVRQTVELVEQILAKQDSEAADEDGNIPRGATVAMVASQLDIERSAAQRRQDECAPARPRLEHLALPV